jgi:hypothetical protein
MSRYAIAAAVTLAAAAGQGAGAEEAPSAFACEFKDGNSWTYASGTFSSKHPSALSFEIEAIDLEKQSAVLKTNAATELGKLSVVRAINANHFLEVVNEGFLNLTTIYDKDAATGLYPAAHSRHFGVLGEPLFAQYTGTCRAR